MIRRFGYVAFFVLAFTKLAPAQYEDYLHMLRTDLKADRVAIFTHVLALTDSQSTVFWPLYKNYESELSLQGDKRIALIKDYAAHYATMTDAKADELLKGTFDLQDSRGALQRKYAKEFGKVLPATTVARFFQTERFVTALVDLQIMSELPLVEKAAEVTAPADTTKK